MDQRISLKLNPYAPRIKLKDPGFYVSIFNIFFPVETSSLKVS